MAQMANKDITEFKFIVGLNPLAQNILIPDSIKKLCFERENKDVAYTGGRIVSSCLYFISKTSNIETITIDYGVVKPTNAADSIRAGTNLPATLKTIHLYVDTSAVTGWDRFLYDTHSNSNVHGLTVDGTPIDFSAMTKWQNTLDFVGLKEIRFVPNKISVSTVTIENKYTAEYSDDTWASLINALKANQGGTLTIGSTAITKISSIMGFNSSGLFVIDSSGSMSLFEFATTVKGWTVV